MTPFKRTDIYQTPQSDVNFWPHCEATRKARHNEHMVYIAIADQVCVSYVTASRLSLTMMQSHI